MNKLALIAVVVLGIYSAKSNAKEVIRIPTFTTEHPIIEYLYLQLEQAIRVTELDYGETEVVRLKIPVEEKRQLRNLNQSITDIAWATCSLQRNEDYQPVLVPQIAGLFGLRVNLIREGDTRFANINSVDALKGLVAVQSSKWHDYDILVHNGFTVLSSDRFSAYRAVEKGLADYYPRGIAEVLGEMKTAQTKRLVIAPEHALRYPLLFLVYVKKGNTALAQRLTTGFERNIQSGDFLELMESQQWYQQARSILRGRTIFALENSGSLGKCLQAEKQYQALLQAPYGNN
ncbi:MAG: amino acid ABC transporter substrate-binding protein [Gammaproteobacteria bacterium]|nr:amino acid ABC transporter substrate-binding protein [Gammaproteobacteria bacterium]